MSKPREPNARSKPGTWYKLSNSKLPFVHVLRPLASRDRVAGVCL